MDLNEQVARRRAELAEKQQQAKDDQQATVSARKAEATAQREAVVDELAAELNATGVPARREGEELAIEQEPSPPLDTEGLNRRKLDSLVKREARKLWTPTENWIVISSIVGGLALVHLAGLGLIPFFFGIWKRNQLEDRYVAQVLELYPQLRPA